MNNFEHIKSQVKLSDVAEQDLNLKRNGKVRKACCPFHQENTPSFTLYPDQTFHCFGCERNGTVIDYIMYRENIKDPLEAAEYMADKFNLALDGFDKEAWEHKKRTVKENRSQAAENFRNRKKAESFLAERGFQPATTKKYGVGFSIAQNAISIPYLDTYGNVVGHAFRNLDEGKPKYVNSTEDNVFKKSELLYGLDKARKSIKDRIYIVEGYFDVMAMDQMGYPAVAYCGQSLTDGQVILLSKYIQDKTKIYLIPDNDKTGLKHVSKNIKTIKQKMKNPISVIPLPDGVKDANDILMYGMDIKDFEPEPHEMFLLKQELNDCLEVTDEYEVARRFAKYTKNKMLRAEMADYLSKRWKKPKAIVSDHMETEEAPDYDSDLKTFSTSLQGYKEIAAAGTSGKAFFNIGKIDSVLNGVGRGEVMFLMGRSGAGKTTLALNFIHNLAVYQQKNIIFNSLELTSENIVPQLLQIHNDETQGAISKMVLNGEMDKKNELFLETMEQRLRIVDRPGQTVDDIERYAIMANETHFDEPAFMIVIDYFQYIKKEGRKDPYTENSDNARRMKELAKKLNCLVVCLTQTSREGGKDGSEPLSLQSARDTGAIEETGDYVLGVYRPAAKSDMHEDERQSVLHEYYCQILKNRWGGIGKAQLHFEPQSKIIKDWVG